MKADPNMERMKMTIESPVPWRQGGSLFPNPFGPRFNPRASISSLQREMNRMFSDFWSSPEFFARAAASEEEPTAFLYPIIEMTESDGHVEILAELPGVSEKDIDVTLADEGKRLTIRGEKKSSREKEEQEYYFAERAYGSFRRTITLPAAVDANKVEAKMHNGVLEIKLSKQAPSSRSVKHISVKSG